MILHIFSFLLGAMLVATTLSSAVATVVLPRGVRVRLTRWIFLGVFELFRLRMKRMRRYEEMDALLALYAPVTLLILPLAWIILVMVGYTFMFWGLGVLTWQESLLMSGSSLLTLGFVLPHSLAQFLLTFSEATLGLGLVALVLSYLPSMYGTFARREVAVALLEVRAGSPPSAVEMIERAYRIGELSRLDDLWVLWEVWFAEVQESHTSLAPLCFFRSPQPQHSWITAAGTVLDAASLVLSTVDIPRNPQAALCIRGGYVSLRRIADVFALPYNPNPTPNQPISVTRQEWEEACAHMEAQGVPLQADREQAWRDFAGWRVNYDAPLVGLAGFLLAPPAPWSSDRSLRSQRRQVSIFDL